MALNVSAARDLLGILRAMYAAERLDGSSPVRLQRLKVLGGRLSAAIRDRDEEEAKAVARAVRELVGLTDSLEPVVEASVAHLVQKHP